MEEAAFMYGKAKSKKAAISSSGTAAITHISAILLLFFIVCLAFVYST